MALTLKFSRDDASPFDDAQLRRTAAALKEQHGIMAVVPYELHNFAAQRLDALARPLVQAGATYDGALAQAMRDNQHLAFLARCERSDDDRRCDLQLEA